MLLLPPFLALRQAVRLLWSRHGLWIPLTAIWSACQPGSCTTINAAGPVLRCFCVDMPGMLPALLPPPQAAIFGGPWTPDRSLAATLNSCSHGRSRLTPQNSLVTDLVTLPCGGYGCAGRGGHGKLKGARRQLPAGLARGRRRRGQKRPQTPDGRCKAAAAVIGRSPSQLLARQRRANELNLCIMVPTATSMPPQPQVVFGRPRLPCRGQVPWNWDDCSFYNCEHSCTWICVETSWLGQARVAHQRGTSVAPCRPGWYTAAA